MLPDDDRVRLWEKRRVVRWLRGPRSGISTPTEGLTSSWRRSSGLCTGLTKTAECCGPSTRRAAAWPRILTGDDLAFRIAVPNQGDKPLGADAVCVRPDGSRQAAMGKIVGSRGLLQMPASIIAPGVYRFEWTLMGPSGSRLLSGSRELTLRPYANDQALATRAVIRHREAMTIAEVAGGDGLLAGGLPKQQSWLVSAPVGVKEQNYIRGTTTPVLPTRLTVEEPLTGRSKRECTHGPSQHRYSRDLSLQHRMQSLLHQLRPSQNWSSGA